MRLSLYACVAALTLAAGCGQPALVSSHSLNLPTASNALRNAQGLELATEAAQAPVAKKIPQKTVLHGDERIDFYAWMREKSNPAVVEHIEKENAYTAALMKPTEALQAELFESMKATIPEVDQSIPFREGDYEYLTRTLEGEQYGKIIRRLPGKPETEQVLLDIDAMGAEHEFIEIGEWKVSPDQNLLLFSQDTTGFREYKNYVKDLRTGAVTALDDSVTNSWGSPGTWALDSKTIYYVTDDESKRPSTLWSYHLPTGERQQLLVESDRSFNVYTYASSDGRYLLVGSASSDTSEFRVIDRKNPGAPQLLFPREIGHQYYPQPWNDHWILVTNRGAKENRAVIVRKEDIGNPSKWETFAESQPNATVDSVTVYKDYWAVTRNVEGVNAFEIYAASDRRMQKVTMPEAFYTASLDQNGGDYLANSIQIQYQSPVTPSTLFAYDLKSSELIKLGSTGYKGDLDPESFVTKRIYVSAADGVQVPVSLLYKKGIQQDGSAPLFLEGYGSYGYSYPLYFSRRYLSLLDRGVVVAIPHIRGGGEKGRSWYEDGKLMKKMNSFTDFISVADYLVAEKYTSRDKLAISGASAGGLLMGAVLNLRPDIAKAAVVGVPFVDVLNTMLDDTLPLTTQEYLEWGNPNEKDAYFYIKSYCPYTNIQAKNYPSMLVLTSFNDSQVLYHEPLKYVAKLRELKTGTNPLLLKVNMEGGHGGSSGRYDQYKETAFELAFVLSQIGQGKAN